MTAESLDRIKDATGNSGTKPIKTKSDKPKTKRPVPFPLELDEAQSALASYISLHYGVTLDVTRLNIQDGYLIVSGIAVPNLYKE